MPAISNDYTRCQMLNLASGPHGRGPFVIRQEGSPPDSTTLQQDPFLLRDDGVWVINLTVFSLKEEEQKRFIYPTSVDVIKALDSLHGDPVVEAKLPEGVSKAQLLAALETTASRLLHGLKNAKPVPMP
jgi:hypothetical protein